MYPRCLAVGSKAVEPSNKAYGTAEKADARIVC